MSNIASKLSLKSCKVGCLFIFIILSSTNNKYYETHPIRCVLTTYYLIRVFVTLCHTVANSMLIYSRQLYVIILLGRFINKAYIYGLLYATI